MPAMRCATSANRSRADLNRHDASFEWLWAAIPRRWFGLRLHQGVGGPGCVRTCKDGVCPWIKTKWSQFKGRPRISTARPGAPEGTRAAPPEGGPLLWVGRHQTGPQGAATSHHQGRGKIPVPADWVHRDMRQDLPSRGRCHSAHHPWAVNDVKEQKVVPRAFSGHLSARNQATSFWQLSKIS